ncbi:hypothetical protein RRG08_046827 [Elysia crispata]|uniref:Uncharacterized protein n=1 Tax=Elysia crispata TaxID=231223 RepID=A0AAE0ZNU2_9GAST|nr:hypothetical protein RRG08_046827 [Elysia crispata]
MHITDTMSFPGGCGRHASVSTIKSSSHSSGQHKTFICTQLRKHLLAIRSKEHIRLMRSAERYLKRSIITLKFVIHIDQYANDRDDTHHCKACQDVDIMKRNPY